MKLMKMQVQFTVELVQALPDSVDITAINTEENTAEILEAIRKEYAAEFANQGARLVEASLPVFELIEV